MSQNKLCIVEYCPKDSITDSFFCEYHEELVIWRENLNKIFSYRAIHILKKKRIIL